MSTVTLTKEQVQHKIDHYSATAEGFFQLMEEDPENRETHFLKNQFYAGKADAWIDIYNILFPEMEKDRAYPLNEEDKRKIIESVKFIHAHSHPLPPQKDANKGL